MIQEILALFCGEHYLAFMLILILSCIMAGRNVLSDRVRQSSFWVTIVVSALLIVQDVFESYAQTDPDRQTIRVISCIAGYALRPAAVLGFLLVVWPATKSRWFLWIPVGLNALVYSTALISPIAFSFDSEYRFQRGPLGWIMFPVCLGYLILVLITIHRRFRDRRSGDFFVIYLCAVCCLGAIGVDALYGEVAIVCAILISCLTFYLFLRSQDTDHDPLTRLWNRMVFYEDCRKLKNTITAVASVDMNGLKKTNDELGHDAGDRALKMIARGLRSVASRRIFAYRIGGDEFMLLFQHCTEEEIQQALLDFREEMWKVGMSVSIGYAAKGSENTAIEELIRASDQRMYMDKRQYYQIHDRRQSRIY